MALHSETWQEIQPPSGPLWLPAPARPTFWMGWLASATPFSLGFSQTFPVLFHKHMNVSTLGVSLTASVYAVWDRQLHCCQCSGGAKCTEKDYTEPLKVSSWLVTPFRCSDTEVREKCHKTSCSNGNSKMIPKPPRISKHKLNISFPHLQWPWADNPRAFEPAVLPSLCFQGENPWLKE